MVPPDLRHTAPIVDGRIDELAVFLDFDGTITTVDTGVHLLDTLAPACWHEIEAEYKTGRIGSRECMTRQWALLPPVTILSDGYGFRAEQVGTAIGVPVITNRIDWLRHEVVFGELDPSCPCQRCGTCKRAPLLAAKARGRVTVLVGDGASDARAAEVADVVFAKHELITHCVEAGIAYRRFLDLADVLEGLRSS